MLLRLHVTGPHIAPCSVDIGTDPIILGRSQDVNIHLPDPEKSISRRHLQVQAAPGGVLVQMLSEVCSADTSKGELAPGQSLLLGAGDTLQVGPYTITLSEGTGPGVATVPPPGQGPPTGRDVFAEILGSRNSASRPQDRGMFAALNVPPPSQPAAPKDLFQALRPQAPALPPQPVGLDPSLVHGSSGRRPLDVLSLVPTVSPTRSDPGQFRADMPVFPKSDLGLPVSSQGPLTPPFSPPPTETPTAGQAPPSPEADFSWGNLQKSMGASAEPAISPAPTPSPEAPSNGLGASGAFGPAPSFGFSDVFGDQGSVFRLDTPTPSTAGAPGLAPPNSPPAQGVPVPTPGAATGQDTAALSAFLDGIGITEATQLDEAQWREVGGTMRLIIDVLTGLLSSRAAVKRELSILERTQLAGRANNPLKVGMEADALIRFLLFTPQGLPGYMPARQALDESLADLRAHELASVAASRAALEGTLRDFHPDKLRDKLLEKKGRSRLAMLESSKLWDAYVQHYGDEETHLADWLDKLIKRHFVPAYSRESARLRADLLAPDEGQVL